MLNSANTLTTSFAVTLTQWSLITVTYVYDIDYGCFQYIYEGTNEIGSSRVTANCFQTFDPTNDIIRIGGPPTFLGGIKNLHIYTPGSVRVGGIFHLTLDTKITLFSAMLCVIFLFSSIGVHRTSNMSFM